MTKLKQKLLNTDYADGADSRGFFIFCFIRANPPDPCHPRSKKGRGKFKNFSILKR